MNGSGQRPDVQDSLWQLQAPQAILDTLTKVTHNHTRTHLEDHHNIAHTISVTPIMGAFFIPTEADA